jgi:hypothetical protein
MLLKKIFLIISNCVVMDYQSVGSNVGTNDLKNYYGNVVSGNEPTFCIVLLRQTCAPTTCQQRPL